MNKIKFIQFLVAILVGYLIFKSTEGVQEPVEQESQIVNSMPLMDPAGRKVSDLSELKGKVVLVSFWATWCEPCKKEIPELVKLKELFPGDEFEILLINEDEAEKGKQDLVLEFFDSLKVDPENFLLYFDKDFKNAELFSVEVLPTSILLDQDRRQIFSAQGYIDWLDEKRIAEIKSLFEN